MPEPLENLYNKQLITKLANELSVAYPAFDKKAFNKSVFDKNWEKKE